MTLSLRQSGPVIYDDQGPALSNHYAGDSWLHWSNLSPEDGYYNDTVTWTNSSGDSFWFTFNGA